MTKWIPDGWHSVTPRLVVHDPARLISFLKAAFAASGEIASDVPSLIKIGDSTLIVSGVGPREAMPCFLYLYLPDVDDAYKCALGAGALSLEEPMDMPYGDRRAMIKDPCDNVWQIATHKR